MEFFSNTVFIIALFSFILFILFTMSIFLFGYLGHFRKYIFPYLQFPSIFMLTLAILLQIIFFLGSTFPNNFAIIEFAMFLIMSFMFYLFYHQFIPKILTIEAIKHCNSGSYSSIKTTETLIVPQINPNSEENFQEIIEENYSKKLRREIEKTVFSGISDSEFQKKCILFIISEIRKFKHMKLLSCLGDRKSETEREANSVLTRFQWNIRVFCVFMPLIFFIVEVMKHSHVEKKVFIIVLNLIKTFITMHFMYESNFVLSNITGFVKSSILESRLNCIRVLFILLMIQNVLVSAIGLRGERDMSLNFAVMSIENCILCYFWIKFYGAKACGLDTFKEEIGKSVNVYEKGEKGTNLLMDKQEEEAGNL